MDLGRHDAIVLKERLHLVHVGLKVLHRAFGAAEQRGVRAVVPVPGRAQVHVDAGPHGRDQFFRAVPDQPPHDQVRRTAAASVGVGMVSIVDIVYIAVAPVEVKAIPVERGYDLDLAHDQHVALAHRPEVGMQASGPTAARRDQRVERVPRIRCPQEPQHPVLERRQVRHLGQDVICLPPAIRLGQFAGVCDQDVIRGPHGLVGHPLQRHGPPVIAPHL